MDTFASKAKKLPSPVKTKGLTSTREASVDKKLLYIFFIFLVSFELSSKSLNFEGLKKLNTNDIQSITSIDIFESNLEKDDLNIILKELSLKMAKQ